MTKKLSNTKQISILKRLRRACPFAVFSGNYGYTCGGMVGGVRSSSGMAARSKEARHCMLSCSDLRKAAFMQGYNITLPTHKINAYG